MTFEEWVEFARRSPDMPGADGLAWRVLLDWCSDHAVLLAHIQRLEAARDALEAQLGRQDGEEH